MALTNQIPAGVDYTASRANHHSIPVVTSTADITITPFIGMLIFNSTDNLLYHWSGSAWVAVAALGGTTSATRHEARYSQTSTQSIPNATDTKLQFQTAITTSNDVTASGTGNQDFLLNRAGLWRVSVGVRLQASVAGERTVFLSTGTAIGTIANRFVGDTDSDDIGAKPPSLSASTDIRVTAGTSVCAGIWQDSGASKNTDATFGSMTHIALTWLRP